MRLLWSDECNWGAGISPGLPGAEIWDVRTTDQYQPANELQDYTESPQSVRYDGQGHMVLTAHKRVTPLPGQRPYTSGKVSSPRAFGNQLFLGGMVEARLKLPNQVGVWPAFWMLGQDSVYGWPACGEIDVMELPSTAGLTWEVHQGTHTPSSTNQDVQVGVDEAHMFKPPPSWFDSFHTFSVRWEEEFLQFYVDAQATGYVHKSDVLAAGGFWTFSHRPMYLVLNLAVGGWAGRPDPTWTEASMLVDYVRVYG